MRGRHRLQDGQAVLQALLRANIFVVPLDGEGRWFRYHHLFAGLLKARLRRSLAAAAVAGLHLRAAEWYERNGFVLEAVNHTLAAGDFERAAARVDQVSQAVARARELGLLPAAIPSNLLPLAHFQARFGWLVFSSAAKQRLRSSPG